MGSFRVLFRFSKEGEARFLSHHDLMRLFERALRRAELPVRMTRGFNPHPRFSILSALPLGAEADEEALEVHFDHPVPPGEAVERLGAQLPTGIRPHSPQPLEPGARVKAVGSTYRVEVPEGLSLPEGELEGRLSGRQAVIERRDGKRLDIRPALAALRLDGRVLHIELRHGDRGTPKATEVLAALSGATPPPTTRLRRTSLEVRVAASR